MANDIYISQVPVLKFSFQDFVVIRPFFCAVKHGMRDGMCKDCTALVKFAQLVDTECVVELDSTYTFFFYKNVVFPAQAEYSYFSVDFRLRIFL